MHPPLAVPTACLQRCKETQGTYNLCVCVCSSLCLKPAQFLFAVLQTDGDCQGYLKQKSCGPSKPQMWLHPSAHAHSPIAHYQREKRLGQMPFLPLTLQNLALTEHVEGPPGMQWPRTKSRGPLPVAGDGQGQTGCIRGSLEEGEQLLSLEGLRGTEGICWGKISGRELQRSWHKRPTCTRQNLPAQPTSAEVIV